MSAKSIHRGNYSNQYFSPEFSIKTFKKSYDPDAGKHEALVTFHAGNSEYISLRTPRKEAAYALKRMKKLLTQSAKSF
jgi:hypothetical protein